MPDPRFMRGARPSPKHKLLAAPPHTVVKAPPPQYAYIPKQLSMWGNNQYGDCVSAEEAFAKACFQPEIFIPDQVVIDWARQHGFLEGADLTSVMEAMAKSPMTVNGHQYGDGPYQGVDYSNELVLQSALSNVAALGPVKIAIDANALPGGAGNQSGWSAFSGGHYGNTDHCVAICGYGPAAWLAQQLGVSAPSGAPPVSYLLFTWNTIGFVSHDWIMGTCTEAYLRTPTTTGATPTPPVPPTPPNPWYAGKA